MAFLSGTAVPDCAKPQEPSMFTIEHAFDSTEIVLVDEGEEPLVQDVTINAFDDCVVIEQLDTQYDVVMRVTLSIAQVQDLAAALNLPEGMYQRVQKGG
jgi:hypothetical protein